MSTPYHRFSALNGQRGHQLFHDQVLESYPICPAASASAANGAGAEFLPGGYQADGTVVSYGNDCSVRVTDQYNMPGPCSTWAGVSHQ